MSEERWVRAGFIAWYVAVLVLILMGIGWQR